MIRLLSSLAFGLLLAASLGLKLSQQARPETVETLRQDEVLAFLHHHGFAVSMSDPSESPVWTIGTKSDCRVQITDLAPQGWHRAAVARHAGGQRVVYIYGGRTYAEQPVLQTTLDHYRRRLERYLGMPARPPAIRAMVLSQGCPDALPDAQDSIRLSM
jgi:hypothetical protein